MLFVRRDNQDCTSESGPFKSHRTQLFGPEFKVLGIAVEKAEGGLGG